MYVAYCFLVAVLQDDMITSVPSSENLYWPKDPRAQDIPAGGGSCVRGGVRFGKGVAN